MPKTASPKSEKSALLAKFHERIDELWIGHEHEFMQILEDAESKKVNITFKAVLDFSETAAKIQTHISFSQVVKDAREDSLEDPDQPMLPVGHEPDSDNEPAPAPKKGGKKPEAKKPAKKGGRSGDFVPPNAEAE